MELHHLRVLRELAERGSVSAAAAALHITPSAVSQHLKALQRSAGTPLVTHEGRRVVPTEAGWALAAAAVDVEHAMASARDAIARHAGNTDRVVRVASFPSAARVFLPRLATRFSGHDGPSVTLADHDAAQDDTVAMCGDHDIVIAHRWQVGSPWPSGRVSVCPLLDEPYDVALPAAHPLARQVELAPHDLVDVDWIAGQEGWAPAGIIAAIGAVTGRTPGARHRINDLATAVAMVRDVGGVTLVPRFVGDYLIGDNVVTRPLSGVESRRQVAALSRPDRAVGQAVRAITAALGEIASELRTRHRWLPPAQQPDRAPGPDTG